MTGHRALHDLAAATFEVPDPGTGEMIAPVHDREYVPITSAGSETNTLPDPDRAGLLLTLHMIVDGGDRVITADTAFNAAGNTIITLNDAGDCVVLQSVRKNSATRAYRWQVIDNDGASLS